MDIKEIISAWITSFNPNEPQIKLANERAEICNNCEFLGKRKLKINYCTKCGCPIKKKIFSNKFNPCPLEKWNEVDSKYKNNNDVFLQKKTNKTLF